VEQLPSADSSLPDTRCPSCGSALMGRYCRDCGEKRLTRHDYSIRRYLTEALDAITHLDSKLLRSNWLLVSRPGFLSREYLQGRRVRYVTPLKLFLFVNILYYISITIFYANTFTTPLRIQLHENNYYPSFATQQVERKLEREGITYPSLERRFDEKTAVLSKTLVFALIPVIALLLHASLYRKRRYFAEHLVVATHFWSFVLVLIGILVPTAVLLASWIALMTGTSAAAWSSDMVLSAVVQVCVAIYLYLTLRVAYVASRWYSAVVALAVGWSFFHLVWLYRMMLFIATMSLL
jgi:Protein of unknown function (DUF3667)